MEELIGKVTEKTGISPEQAKTAIATVLGFLKDKLPAPIAGQIENVIGGGGSASAAGAGDVASKLGGLLS